MIRSLWAWVVEGLRFRGFGEEELSGLGGSEVECVLV